jgi:hypothetical protein
MPESQSCSKLLIRRGKFSEWEEQVKQLIPLHWSDVGGMPSFPELKVDIDMEAYKYMEDNDGVLAFGLFLGEEMIGYLSLLISTHHQHKNLNFAYSDGLFINPKYRGIKTFKAVMSMFKIAEGILAKEFNVEYLTLNSNYNKDLKLLANYLDMKPISIEYMKRISK